MRRRKTIPLTRMEQEFLHRIWLENYSFMKFRILHSDVPADDVEDLLDDCFLSLIRNRETLAGLPAEKIRPYISVTVKNRCIAYHIDRAKNDTVPLNEASDAVVPDASASDDTFVASLEQKNAMQLIDSLPDRDRLLLTGHYVEGLSYQELAELLHCRKSNIRTLLLRARKKARSLLTFYEKGGILFGYTEEKKE